MNKAGFSAARIDQQPGGAFSVKQNVIGCIKRGIISPHHFYCYFFEVILERIFKRLRKHASSVAVDADVSRVDTGHVPAQI